MRRLALFTAVLATPLVSFADDCDYSKDYDFAVDASTLESLRMDVGAGSLEINGDSNATEVRVHATACSTSRRKLDEIDLTHRTRGSELLVRTETDRSSSFLSWFSFGYARIDIDVTMPSNLFLDVDDGSGGIEIAGVGALDLDDGSGSVDIRNMDGDVSIDDGSGGITVADVRGSVSVDDGSGSIQIRDSYDVRVNDGSGEILIENIRNNVNIVDDGSGGIRIRDVAGDVDIGNAGSGSVDVSGVAGAYRNRDD